MYFKRAICPPSPLVTDIPEQTGGSWLANTSLASILGSIVIDFLRLLIILRAFSLQPAILSITTIIFGTMLSLVSLVLYAIKEINH